MTLFELGKKHKTDKETHGYLPHYAERFQGKRRFSISLLEIGVMNGASLRMWRDYFPSGIIYGIDIEPKFLISEERIQCFAGRQENKGFLREVLRETGELDFIIDDGSHRGIHHVVSFNTLWTFVKPGGWYCIEDAVTIFNTCWTTPNQRTILDVLQEQWSEILRSRSDIAEVVVVGCGTCMPVNGRNNGLIMMRKAVDSGETEEKEPEEQESYFFSSRSQPC